MNEDRDEDLERYLAILVENVLFTRFRAVDESTQDNKEELKEEMRKQFVETLPESYKNLEKRDEIISSVLERTINNSKKIAKMREEER